MPKIPGVSQRATIAALQKAGFQIIRQRRHVHYVYSQTDYDYDYEHEHEQEFFIRASSFACHAARSRRISE